MLCLISDNLNQHQLGFTPHNTLSQKPTDFLSNRYPHPPHSIGQIRVADLPQYLHRNLKATRHLLLLPVDDSENMPGVSW